MVRHPELGFVRICSLMNGWYEEWQDSPNFKFYRYEDARANTAQTMRDWFAFLGLASPDEAALAHALAFFDFNSVRKREQDGTFENKALAARDTNDPETFKARRGKVGGFGDYLGPEDVAFCNAEMARLLPVFAYRP